MTAIGISLVGSQFAVLGYMANALIFIGIISISAYLIALVLNLTVGGYEATTKRPSEREYIRDMIKK